MEKIKSSIKRQKNEKNIYCIIKRTIDIITAIIGIIILIPITIGVFIANMISRDFESLLYIQTRIGKNGKHFKIYKYRCMCVDADAELERLLKENKNAKKEWKEKQKLSNDPRITKVGHFIRKTNIDELPQFINVLKGDMSLVRA